MKKWNPVTEEWEYLGIGNTEIVAHLSDTDNPHEVTAVQAGAQPVDPTLTALAGVTVTANKLIYGTGSDTFSTTDFTAAARSLLDDTTVSAMRTTLAAASSTTATQNIYVDSAATGAGTGVDLTNAFTTWQAAFDSLPAIINHNVTILGKAGTYSESPSLARIVAGGSVTVRGLYYWSGTCRAASSVATNMFQIALGDSHFGDRAQIAAGDKVLLIKWTAGSVETAAPLYSHETTVASVSDAEITITDATSAGSNINGDWTYTIVKTSITGSVSVSNMSGVTVAGLNIAGTYPVYCSTANVAVTCCNLYPTVYGITGLGYARITANRTNISATGNNVLGTSMASSQYTSGVGMRYNLTGTGTRGISVSGNSYGSATLGHIVAAAIGIKATFGSQIYTAASMLNSGTTAKDPANWAATTDGSYIS